MQKRERVLDLLNSVFDRKGKVALFSARVDVLGTPPGMLATQ